MPLPLIVGIAVALVMIALGIVGVLIDRAAERHEPFR